MPGSQGSTGSAELLRLLGGDAVPAARKLLGAVLTSRRGDAEVAVRLTEVEAYAGEQDPGSHAWHGPTARNATMYGPAGCLYVYFTYGMHWCANVVCGPAGTASAVLLRAGEVVEGIEAARLRRPASRRDADLARGPARLATCLGLDRSCDGAHLLRGDGDLVLTTGVGDRAASIASGPRVGLSRAAEIPWRFWLAGDPTVSAYRPAGARRPRTPPARPRTPSGE